VCMYVCMMGSEILKTLFTLKVILAALKETRL